MTKQLLNTLFIFCTFIAKSQVVSVAPAFPKTDDDITVTYDASKGNAALKDANFSIYAHTGVITNLSTSGSDWKYVKSAWGVADANVLMTNIGNNLYTISYNIRKYYNIPQNETVKKLAFVFRNVNGSSVGRDAGGSDIYYDVYPNDVGLLVKLLSPSASNTLIKKADELLTIKGVASKMCSMRILVDDKTVLEKTNVNSINETINIATQGTHIVTLVADDGTLQAKESFTYIVPSTAGVEIADPPSGMKLGANFTSETTILFKLYAPNKQNIYILGDFNNWQINANSAMKRSVDGTTWWLEVNTLTKGANYAYQYLVDGFLKIADPLSELVLDPNNDTGISSSVYPNMPIYPTGKTTGIVSLVKAGKKIAYNWSSFKRPDKKNLVVYELLVRDFIENHSFQGVIDTLSYFQHLGVNAIELMPISEFENNNSWGYNVSFHNALDKYYGSSEKLKQLVEECHKRGIAVIVDVVFNHAFGQSPLAQLYWDATNNRPSADNPWLNPVATHPFSVGYDFNHESTATKEYVDVCLQHWFNEFNLDGLRFDLAKGFTQKQSSDDSQFRLYDANRIATLKHYADVCWKSQANAYVILELFSELSEETALSDYGMMVWGNMNGAYNEATMGWEPTKHDLSGTSYLNRNWTAANLIAYMESHDEERLMYKNLQYGNTSGSYSVKNLKTALQRNELASIFFYTLPGAKMLWQFGELGYDYSINACQDGSINNNCRVDMKPIKWDYLKNADRKHLFDVTSQLLYLKKNYPVFNNANTIVQNVGATYLKTLQLANNDINVFVIGNFDVTTATLAASSFPKNTKWYEYFSNDSLTITNNSPNLILKAGEYRLYSTQKLQKPINGSLITTSNNELLAENIQFKIYPNPSNDVLYLTYFIENEKFVEIELYNIFGQKVFFSRQENQSDGLQNISIPINDLGRGTYIARLKVGKGSVSKLFFKAE